MRRRETGDCPPHIQHAIKTHISSAFFTQVNVICSTCVCHDGRRFFFPLPLAHLITGSVEQMKAKNKWGLYLVGAEYVTVSSGFILGERVRPKLEKQRQQPYVSYRPQRAAAPETCDRFLMSAWFNIRPGLDRGASLTLLTGLAAARTGRKVRS